MRIGLVFSAVSTFYSLAGWPGAVGSLALCLLGIWWVER